MTAGGPPMVYAPRNHPLRKPKRPPAKLKFANRLTCFSVLGSLEKRIASNMSSANACFIMASGNQLRAANPMGAAMAAPIKKGHNFKSPRFFPYLNTLYPTIIKPNGNWRATAVLTGRTIAIRGTATRAKPNPAKLKVNALSKKQRLINKNNIIPAAPSKCIIKASEDQNSCYKGLLFSGNHCHVFGPQKEYMINDYPELFKRNSKGFILGAFNNFKTAFNINLNACLFC